MSKKTYTKKDSAGEVEKPVIETSPPEVAALQGLVVDPAVLKALSDSEKDRLLHVWSTYVDFYMKYLTLAFTGLSLGFVVLSFGLKIVLVDDSSRATKLGIVIVLLAAAVVGVFLTVRVKKRAGEFTTQMGNLDAAMNAVIEHKLPTQNLSGHGIMTEILRASALAGLFVVVMLTALVVLLVGGWIPLPGL